MKFDFYTDPFDGYYYWVNDGHTLKLVKYDSSEKHILTGNAVENGHYKFRQLHFHWVIFEFRKLKN